MSITKPTLKPIGFTEKKRLKLKTKSSTHLLLGKFLTFELLKYKVKPLSWTKFWRETKHWFKLFEGSHESAKKSLTDKFWRRIPSSSTPRSCAMPTRKEHNSGRISSHSVYILQVGSRDVGCVFNPTDYTHHTIVLLLLYCTPPCEEVPRAAKKRLQICNIFYLNWSGIGWKNFSNMSYLFVLTQLRKAKLK